MFLKRKLKFPEHFRKKSVCYTFFYDSVISKHDCIKCLLKTSAFILQNPGKRFFVVWHSFSVTLEENTPWKFPYVPLLLYIFMWTVSFLTTLKTYALFQVISPEVIQRWHDAWIYTDHAKLRSQVWHLNLLKVIVPEDIKRCRLCPPAPGGHVIPLQSVIKLLGLIASLTDKRLSLNSFFSCNVLPNVKPWIGVKMGDYKYKSWK